MLRAFFTFNLLLCVWVLTVVVTFSHGKSNTMNTVSSSRSGAPILVMMIDTGVDSGHKLLKDYVDTSRSTGIAEGDGPLPHGTHIAGLILYGDTINRGEPVGLCHRVRLVSCNRLHLGGSSDIPYCLKLAKSLGVKYVNISGGGATSSSEEETLMRDMNAHGTVFVVAAGNESSDIDQKPYYPASYHLSNMIVVANGTDQRHKGVRSNWGRGIVWEKGDKILSTAPGDSFARMTGTSMSTAIRLHRILMSQCKTLHRIHLSPYMKGEMMVRTMLHKDDI